MRNLLLLTPLLLEAGVAFPCEPVQDGSALASDEDVRAVTLDITGMT